MTTFRSRLQAVGPLLVLTLPSVSLAQFVPPTTTIVYAPAAAGSPTAVPTLSEWGLIALAAVMVFAAIRALRRGTGGRLLSLAIVAAASLAGTQWTARPAMAVPAFTLSNAAGGTATWLGDGEIGVLNTTGVAQKIISVGLTGTGMLRPTEGSPRCVAGLVVNAGQQCYVNVAVPL